MYEAVEKEKGERVSMLQMQDTRIAGIAGDLCYQYVVAGQIQLGTNIVLTSIFVHKWRRYRYISCN